MAIKAGSKKVVAEDGTITYELPTEVEEVMEEKAAEQTPTSADPTFTVTASTMKEMITEGVSEAMKQLGVAKPAQGPIKNSDLVAAAVGSSDGMQSQDSVDMLGLSSDGRTHGVDFIPGVPEWIANFDLQENQDIIGEVVNLGYRVTLKGVEFQAEWWPTEWRTIGEREIEFDHLRNPPPEPEGNEEVLQRLRDTTPAYCLSFILEHREERTIGSERKLQMVVAGYKRAGFQRNPSEPNSQAMDTMNSLRARAGDMGGGGLDNLNIDIGSQAGADAVERVSVN